MTKIPEWVSTESSIDLISYPWFQLLTQMIFRKQRAFLDNELNLPYGYLECRRWSELSLSLHHTCQVHLFLLVSPLDDSEKNKFELKLKEESQEKWKLALCNKIPIGPDSCWHRNSVNLLSGLGPWRLRLDERWWHVLSCMSQPHV